MSLWNKRLRAGVLCLSLILCYLNGRAQRDSRVVIGTTLDSLTRLPVPFVTVWNQSSKHVTSSQQDGTFTIPCSTGDTIIFSMVGYKMKKRIVITTAPLVILLSEKIQMLRPVTIYGSFKPQGSEKWDNAIVMPKAFRNPAGPGSGYAVETFGPGYVFQGVFSRFSKGEKEKRKLKKEKNEHVATKIYRNTITSPEVKEYFQKTFSLSEIDYSKKIERFNAQYPEAAYSTSKDEIVKMLVIFFAMKEN